MRRRKWIIAATIPAVLFVGWLGVRETQDRINRQRAYPVIESLGGRIGSIRPSLLFRGSELRIGFHNTQFKHGEIKRLAVLRPLTSTHAVGVMFKDTNTTRQDVIELRQMLPECAIFRVVEGEIQDDR